MLRLGIAAILGLVATSEVALTAATLDTIAGSPNPPGEVWGLGEGANETNGQTFTVPLTDNVLTSFRLMLADEDDGLYDQYGFTGQTKFDFKVMAWNGTRATGSSLFSSGPLTVTTGNYTPAEFTFNTGNLALTPGGQYVAFVTTSERADGANDFATVANAGDPYGGGGDAYAGGDFVYLDNGTDTSAWTTTNWTKLRTDDAVPMDAAFRATFVAAVPEPSSAGAFIAAGAFLGLRRRSQSVNR